MYKCYPLKHFGAFIVFIDREMIEFRKQRLINRGNTVTHCHSAASLPNSKSDNRINKARFDASVGVLTRLANVTQSNAAAGADSNPSITEPIVSEICT